MRNWPQDSSGLLVCPTATADTALRRLIAVPHAGSGPNSVAGWSKLADRHTEMLFVRLPGRESRFSEPALTDALTAGTILARKLRALPDLPTTLMGHSMGALIAYLTAAKLSEDEWPYLNGLVVSGLNPPESESLCPKVGNLPDRQFVHVLQELGGLPPELLENLTEDSEVIDLFLPILRSDFALVETYEHTERPALTCAVFAVSGENDPLAPPEVMEGWNRYSTGPFHLITHSGGHFEVTEKGGVWQDAMNKALNYRNRRAREEISNRILSTPRNGGYHHGHRT